MLLHRFFHDGLAQAGYLLGDQATGEALLIDPNRDLDQYIAAAEREGLRITAVTETHIHADFVSGAREFAARTGATLYLSDAGPAPWKYAFARAAGARLLRDGDHFEVGTLRIDVWHTPGHTPEHLSFLVTDTAVADRPMGIFTGDFVFVGDVGRPDLLEKAAGVADTMAAGARDLFHSLQRFRDLPDFIQVWPGHGAGSACGRALGAVPQTTVGYEKLFNWALAIPDADTFVDAVLEGQPEPPPYFAHMKRLNQAGPPFAAGEVAPLSLEQLSALLDTDTLLVDVRSAAAFAAGHIPGALNLPAGKSFVTWAGWLLPYDRPFVLLVDAPDLPAVLTDLRLIGLDHVSGYAPSTVLDAWRATDRPLDTFARLSARETHPLLTQDGPIVVDVRTPEEFAAGHIPGSLNLPLTDLPQRVDDLPTDRSFLVHCQGGGRSPIAASLLQAHGRSAVTEMRDGFSAWAAAGFQVDQPNDHAPSVTYEHP